MKLATFLPPGATQPRAGEVRDGEAIAFGGGESVLDRLRWADDTPADGDRRPPDEVPAPEDLRLRTWVNGELRQDARTSDLIFGVEELLRFLRETCTLEPGDLILTGTPSGVGMALDPPQFLGPGDVVRIEIERLGAIEHSVQ